MNVGGRAPAGIGILCLLAGTDELEERTGTGRLVGFVVTHTGLQRTWKWGKRFFFSLKLKPRSLIVAQRLAGLKRQRRVPILRTAKGTI